MDSVKQQQQMNDYWHIPRASLSPSSASSAVSSASSTQRSNRSQNKQKLTPTHYRQQQQLPSGVAVIAGVGGRRDSEMSANTSAAVTAAAAAAVLAAAKRGSRSSQGSNDSNNSTRSAASGSLLLTAANLERMAEIHKKQQQQQQQLNQRTAAVSSTYNANLVQVSRDYQLAVMPQTTDARGKINHQQQQQQLHQNQHQDQTQTDAVINIDPNLNFIRTKDLDTVSIASSMHFTMVNGEAGNKKTKKGLCDRGRQVTVLIMTMSTIFLLLIIGMVYALEMRAREMPQS
ncbi:putative uncharacterized protein DDB_G0277255 isoform X1 [Calliphora vicina]|uniref:putative uncharacterized protein DDB_G0277255 isoform X1 n=2 Tax=Calliphora vicina TaxID=7373 RepID=UPI00325C01BA